MDDKFDFYEEYGVEEYYMYDPDNNKLTGYVRQGTALLRVRPIHYHVSPRLKIRFDLSGPEMVLYGPDGKRFRTFEELTESLLQTEQKLDEVQRQNARLRELSRKARRGEATAEELQELNHLEEPSP